MEEKIGKKYAKYGVRYCLESQLTTLPKTIFIFFNAFISYPGT
jgi:hypothetical protein